MQVKTSRRRKYKDKIVLTESQRWWIYKGNVFDNLAVWELKTIATIKALWDRNEQIYKPKPWHVKQVLFYSHCLGLEKVRLCYISFDGYRIFTEQDFEISREEVVKELVERALEFHKHWKNDTPPEKTCQEWECKFCEVKQFCEEVDSDA